MAKTRRVVRKLKPEAVKTFDEQLWPINVALLALGGILAGVIVRVFRFDDPRGGHNAAFWLSILSIVMGLSLSAVWRTRGTLVRRAALLSLVLSLLVNVLLLVLTAGTTIFHPLSIEEVERVSETAPEPEVVIPEYPVQQADRRDFPRRDFEKPVATGTPQVQAAELAQQLSAVPAEPLRTPMPPSPEPVEPDRWKVPSEKAEMESAPRRSEQASRLTRQFAQPQPPAAQQVAAVETVPPSQLEPARTESTNVPLSRRAPEVRAPAASMIDEEPAATLRTPETQIAKRQPEQEPLPRTSMAPTLRREIAQPSQTPRTLAQTADEPTAARETAPEQLQPNITAVPRRRNSTARIPRTTVEPAIELPTRISRRTARRSEPAEAAPQIAQSLQSRQSRRRVTESRPQSGPRVADVELAPSPSLASSSPLVPSPTTISRQSAVSATSPPRNVTTDTSAFSRQLQASPSTIRRPIVADVPAVAPEPNPDNIPSRALRAADIAASPASVPTPASSVSVRPTSDPAAQPARTAVAKSTGGVAGMGSSPNMDRGLPADSRNAQVASASARRATSVQQLPPGPAISPSAVARRSRSIAGSQSPSATLEAQPVEVANVAGSTRPADMEANASAAIVQAAANAPRATVTASKGDAEIDLGPVRIVSGGGSGRAAGGGQPVLNVTSQARRVARSAAGGAPRMAIDAKTVSDAPVAPGGRDGGEPRATEASSALAEAVKSQTSGDVLYPASTSERDNVSPSAMAARGNALATPQPGRATEFEASPGPVQAGGGNLARRQIARSPAFAANRRAATDFPAGTDASRGITRGDPAQSEAAMVIRRSPGVVAAVGPAVTGAVAGPEPVDALLAGEPGVAPGSKASSHGSDGGPQVLDAFQRGAPLARAARTVVPGGIATRADADVPPATASSPLANRDSDEVEGGLRPGPLVRQEEGALPVSVAAPRGPGGLADEVALDAGMINRRAQVESIQLEPRAARFVRRRVGQPIAPSVTASIAADAFQQRLQRHGDPDGGGLGQLSPKTEEAIELGLAFLTRHQSPDGSWSLNNFGAGRDGYEFESASMHSDTAATGLALLCYLGAGYHHQDHQYKETVRNALDYLISNQKSNGDLYVAQDPQSSLNVALYSHGIAAIALSEAYGMTQDPTLRQPAQRALDFIAASQQTSRGGWRYEPRRGSDTSVTGWMVMALKSGELAGLNVSDDVYRGVERWLESAQASSRQPHLYRYNPFAPDTATQRHGRQPTKTMTSVGLLMRLYLGWRRDDPRMKQGADYLLENLPELGTLRDPQRDTYFWYYATQVMFHMGGKHWEDWNNRLHPLLIDSQVTAGPMAGSWDPRNPVPDRWGPHAGRIYVTTMNVLSLEVSYRYLPIYEDTAR